MEFMYFDILQVAASLLVLFISYKLYSKKMWKSLASLWLFVIIMFLNMPVVSNIKDNQVLFTNGTETLPEKVEVKNETFEEKLNKDLNNLRKENKQTEENINE